MKANMVMKKSKDTKCHLPHQSLSAKSISNLRHLQSLFCAYPRHLRETLKRGAQDVEVWPFHGMLL